MGYWNVISIVLGLIALGLPFLLLLGLLLPATSNTSVSHRTTILSKIVPAISLSACGFSLLFQMKYQDHLVTISDWSALMDTSEAVTRLANILLLVTVVLNFALIVVAMKKKKI